uniref:Uncharacterized protein n=1 Tax=Anguilla anguilla TaxID=7936 RepID=A0A0E9UNU9_ANGAN
MQKFRYKTTLPSSGPNIKIKLQCNSKIDIHMKGNSKQMFKKRYMANSSYTVRRINV